MATATKTKVKKPKEPKAIGKITHYYGHLGVAIVKWSRAVKVGEAVHFKGMHTDFVQTISSMQYDHKDIASAKKGQEVGIKVDQKVHDTDQIYEVE